MSKKNKHANNQAKYMERKRESGQEWLTEWVPAPAFPAFKAIAKAARKAHGLPSEAHLAEAAALAATHQCELPDWARGSDVLLSVWATATVATAALDQLHAEREETKTKKADAKSAKATKSASPSESPADDVKIEDSKVEEPKAEEPLIEEPQAGAHPPEQPAAVPVPAV